jgi:ribosomal-protein-alanine N-acetyltransferase
MNRGIFRKTERIGFSRWQAEDLVLASTLWGNREVTRYISGPNGFSKEDIQNRLAFEMNCDREAHVQYWPIFDLATGHLIGCCGLHPHGENEYELGYHLLPSYWGKGYATEAARSAADYAFSEMKAKSLWAGHHPDNAASKKILLSLGFKPDGFIFYPPTGLNHPTYRLIK